MTFGHLDCCIAYWDKLVSIRELFFVPVAPVRGQHQQVAFRNSVVLYTLGKMVYHKAIIQSKNI